MAEFQEIVRQGHRMCAAIKNCKRCPMRDNALCLCFLPRLRHNVEQMEIVTMAWAAKHPELEEGDKNG